MNNEIKEMAEVITKLGGIESDKWKRLLCL